MSIIALVLVGLVWLAMLWAIGWAGRRKRGCSAAETDRLAAFDDDK